MNRYYNVCLISLIPLFSLQAMEVTPHITGYIYIDGPVAYGPEKYYTYLNKNGISADVFEPLVQVGVVIKDKDEGNNNTEILWTNNDVRRIPQEKRSPLLDIIDAKGTEQKYFPSYIPVNVFKNVTQKRPLLQLSIFKSIAQLQFICSPTCNLIKQISDFIKTPRYFKWKTESFQYTPILELMEKRFIKQQPAIYDDIDMVLELCHTNSKLCSRYCLDQHNYEHGTEGIKTVEQLKSEFAHILALTGKVILWPSSEKDKEEKKRQAPSGTPLVFPDDYIPYLVPDARKFNQAIDEEEARRQTISLEIGEYPEEAKTQAKRIAKRIKLSPDTQTFNQAIEEDRNDRSQAPLYPMPRQNFGSGL